MNEHIALVLASIIGLGLLSQLLSWWVKLPAILFLLIGGIIVGQIGWLDPDHLFGDDLLFPLVSLSVAVILFEGSLTLNFKQLKGIQRVVLNMVTIGMLVTWCLVSVLTHYLIGFQWTLAWLFGAIMVVTGPTVIVPMLRTIRPKNKIAQVLRWEGILIDPIGALLAVLVFDYIMASTGAVGEGYMHAILIFGETILLGLVAGAIGGWTLGTILRQHLIPEYLHNILALTLVIGVYVISNDISPESGLLAVTVMGVWLANMKNVDIKDILSFKEDLTMLLVSALFIILAARINFEQLQAIGWSGVFLFFALQFIVRPAKIFVATKGSDMNWREKALLGWVAPRGIVAAAVSAIFALKLEAIQFEGADLLVPLTFMMIIGTVVFQSATARPLASFLKVSDPEPNGFLIVGANPVGRAIARALKEEGVRVLVSDTSWEKIRDARMEGLDVYYGDVTSEHADRHLDLVGLGRLLAISSREEINRLSVVRFQREFSKQDVFRLCAGPKSKAAKAEDENQNACLFGKKYHYSYLMKTVSNGAEIRKTSLTDEFTYEHYLEQYGDSIIPLFVRNTKGRLFVLTEKNKVKLMSGWEVMSFVLPENVD